jgi:hypothetical protein
MGILDIIRRRGPGRRAKQPARETVPFPSLAMPGMGFNVGQGEKRASFKPIPRNLRYFAKTPYARRAINAIKNPVGSLEWEVVPVKGADKSKELDRQIELVTYCLEHPNTDDNWHSFCHALVEDVLMGAGAYEQQVSGDPLRPLWIWPVDGLTIQIYAGWAGGKDEARYMQVVGYGDRLGTGAASVNLRNDELVYIRPNPNTSTPFGLGPLEVAFTSISRILGVSEFAGNVASNARPSIGIDLGEGAGPAELQAFRQYWTNDVEGRGIMPVFGLPGSVNEKTSSSTRGPTILRLYPEGDNGLYLKYQEFLKREIATAFDLSPQNLGVEKDVNRATAEVAEDRDWDAAIKPMASLVAGHVSRETIQGKLGFSQLEFKFVGLDREDEQATAVINQMRYHTNTLTPNEIRAKYGEEPSDNSFADLLYVDHEVALAAARSLGQQLDENLIDSGTDSEGSPVAPAAKPQLDRNKRQQRLNTTPKRGADTASKEK